MIGLDTNVLIGLLVSSSSSHGEIKKDFDSLDDEFCTTPTNIGEVLRILTHPKVFSAPLKVDKAVSTLSDFFDSHSVRILDEDPDWWKSLIDIEKQIPGLKENEIFDTRIAICLRQHNVKRIFTRDSDFQKFPFLRVVRFLNRK